MSKFIQVPTARQSAAYWRINVDHIVSYDGAFIWLAGERGKIGQTVTSDELDRLINNAQSGSADLIPSIQVPTL